MTAITHSRAKTFSAASKSYEDTPAAIVAMINKAAPLMDKKKGALIYFGRYPDGISKRTYEHLQAITALPLDYDGRNGDTLTRTEAERIITEAGVHAILWNSFSSDGQDTTFRLVLLLATEHATDISHGLTRAVAEKIGLPLPLTLLPPTQGFFFAPRAGGQVTTNARHIEGTQFADQLLEDFEIACLPLNEKLDASLGDGKYSDGDIELTEEQFQDAVQVLHQLREQGAHLSDGKGVWHRVAQALCGYTQGDELFLAFSEGDKNFDPHDCRVKLRQKRKGHATSIAHLFNIAAAEFGIENPATARRTARPSAFDDFADELADKPHDDRPPMYCETLTCDQMIQRFCFIEEGQRVIDRANPNRVMSRPDFQAAYLPSWTPTPTPTDPTHKTSSTKLWMFSEGKMQLGTITWRPGYPERTVNPEGKPAYNTFRVRKLPEFAFNQGYVDMFLRHIEYLFGDRAEDFLNWFAHIEQRPGELAHTAWLNIATQTGIGRNWLTSLSLQLWPGEVAANYDLVGQIDSNFNDALSKKRLIMVDEIRVAGQGGHKLEQRLKSIINEETRHINPKYGHKSIEYNCARWLMFSNHRSAIPMDNGDRRYEVVINDGQPMDLAYYAALYGSLKNKAFALSVLTFLRERDISAFSPGQRAKLTDSKKQVVESSRSALDATIRETLNDYPYGVITGRLLRDLSGLGVEVFEKSGNAVSRIIEDCGWVKVGFIKKGTNKLPAYCRAHEYARYHGKQSIGIPTDAQIAAMMASADFGEDLP